MSNSPVDLPADVRLRLVLAEAGGHRLGVLEVQTRVRTVEATADLVVTVAAPDLSAVLAPGVRPAEGEHTLTWPHEDGQLELPVLLDSSGDLWRLVGNGPTRHVSLRHFPRTHRDVPVVLSGCAPGAATGELRGMTVDISAGGALCALAGGPPDLGAAVTVTFELPEHNLAGTGVVVRHETLPDGRPAAAVRFDEPELVDNALMHVDIAQFLGGNGPGD